MKGSMVKCRICKFAQDMQSITLAVSKMEFFMTLQLKAFIHRLKSQRTPSYTLHIKMNIFPETRCFCSMMDVLLVLEFHSAKLCLLKQLPITKITQISTLKLTLNRSYLFLGWVLNGGRFIIPQEF